MPLIPLYMFEIAIRFSLDTAVYLRSHVGTVVLCLGVPALIFLYLSCGIWIPELH